MDGAEITGRCVRCGQPSLPSDEAGLWQKLAREKLEERLALHQQELCDDCWSRRGQLPRTQRAESRPPPPAPIAAIGLGSNVGPASSTSKPRDLRPWAAAAFVVVLMVIWGLGGGANGAPSRAPSDGGCGSGYYQAVSGSCVRRPGSSPTGASFRCADGTYSYSERAQGACSSHGGID